MWPAQQHSSGPKKKNSSFRPSPVALGAQHPPGPAAQLQRITRVAQRAPLGLKPKSAQLSWVRVPMENG